MKNFGSTSGLTVLAEDQATPANGMVAHVTSSYQSGWQNGDIKLAALSDTDDTDLVGSGELVTNGTFDTDTDWTKGTGWTISGGTANKANGTGDAITQANALVEGNLYAISFEVSGATAGVCGPILTGSTQITGPLLGANGSRTEYLVAPSAPTAYGITASATFDGSVDNVSVKLADEDRSVNSNGLIVNGTVTREPVATGADLVAYSGFSSSNYLEMPYNSDLDFGTGDFCVMGWVNFSVGNQSDKHIVVRGSIFRLHTTLGKLRFTIPTVLDVDGVTALPVNVWSFACVVRVGGVIKIYFNGQLESSAANSSNLTSVGAATGIGARPGGFLPFDVGSLALWRISATAPTAEQIAKIYEDEKFLFQENAGAVLAGTSDAVTALAYDEGTQELLVGTSQNTSVFRGLRRVETISGSASAISASNGLRVIED